MITDTEIAKTLHDLDSLYNPQSTQAKYYSKLALLELCGWLEESMDTIIEDYALNKLVNVENKKYVSKNIIKTTYGFHYESHFRPMLMKVIGITQLEVLENNLKADLSTLDSQLNTLKEARNKIAHTSLHGVQFTFEAPSILIQNLKILYPCLKNIETGIAAL